MIKYFMIGDNGQSVTGLAGSFGEVWEEIELRSPDYGGVYGWWMEGSPYCFGRWGTGEERGAVIEPSWPWPCPEPLEMPVEEEEEVAPADGPC